MRASVRPNIKGAKYKPRATKKAEKGRKVEKNTSRRG